MKKLVFILFIIILSFILYCTFRSPQDVHFHHFPKNSDGAMSWTLCKPPTECFTALFPKEPTQKSRTLTPERDEHSLNCNEYAADLEQNKHFSISYTQLPQRWLKYGHTLVLNGALKAIMQERGKVSLVGKKRTTFKSFPALDYEHYNGKEESSGVLVLVGPILYKVEVTYPMDLHDEVQEELENFIGNFNPSQSPQIASLEVDRLQHQ